jgi:hypothetical protein
VKALIRGERIVSAGVAAGLVGLICLLVASLGLNIKHHGDLDRLQRLIYVRCVSLSGPQNTARQVEVTEWRQLASQNAGTAQAGSYTRLADAMQAAVEASQRNNCTQYKP